MNYYYLNASQFYFYELMRGRSYGSHKELMEKLAPALRIEQYFCLYFLDGRIFIIGSSYELSDILAGVMAYDGIKLLDYNWENFEALAGYGDRPSWNQWKPISEMDPNIWIHCKPENQ